MTQKTALITGFPGQDACYLADLLLDKGYKVYGIVKRYSCPNWSNLEYLSLFDKGLELITADVTDIGSLFDAVEIAQPDEFYNLAAQSYVGGSWRLSHTTTMVDAQGPLNCLEVIKRTNPKIRFYQAATSEMFGNAHTNGVQTEETPFMPRSPYGVAKLYGYHITRNFRESYGIYACSGILFNHESPIRGIEFVTRKITDGVARIKAGLTDKLVLGNLDARRDWGFAGDFVEAQWLMLQQDQPEDFIISTGKQNSVREVCEIAFKVAGLPHYSQYVQSSQEFKRPAELDSLQGVCDKAKNKLGWEPKMSFEELITLMTEEDLKRYKDKCLL
jgi:GDPmannose 4,6-dehydratase